MCFVGCGCDKAVILPTTDHIYIYSNENFALNDSLVELKNIEGDAEYKIEDTAIAVIYNNSIIPQRPGNTKLIATVGKLSCEIPLTILDGLVVNSASLQYENIELNLSNRKVYYNKLDCNKHTETPVVTYDESVISYNYETGLVEAKGVGSTTVTIAFKKVTKTFNVVVVDKIYIESMSVNDCSITVGDFDKFAYVVMPKDSNTFKFWTNSDLLNVSTDGYYQALKSGVAVVYYQYNTSKDSLSEVFGFNVIIREQAPLYSVKVTNNYYSEIDSVFVGDEFNVVVNLSKDYYANRLKITGNVDVLQDFKFINNVGFVAVCKFNIEPSNQIIAVDYIVGIQDDMKLSYSTNVRVCSIKDVEVKLKQGIIILNSNNNNYNVVKDNITTSKNLTLSLVLGNQDIISEYSFYIVNGEDRLLIENNKLNIDDFDFLEVEGIFKGEIIAKFTITVKK
jgi:hypothetical protein